MNLRLRGPQGQSTLSGVDDTVTVAQFQALLQEKTGVPPLQQEILAGFPPKPLQLPTDRDTATVASLGLQSGDNLTVRELPAPQGASALSPVVAAAPPAAGVDAFSIQGLSEDEQLARAIAASLGEPPTTTTTSAPVAAPPAAPYRPAASTLASRVNTLASSSSSLSLFEAVGDGTYVARRVVANDNSCLFSAVGYVTRGTRAAAPLLRSMAAEAVLSDPFEWNEAVLGKDPAEYATWIRDSRRWGGAIELSIFSNKLGKEIAAFDIQTQRVDVYGQGSGYTDRVLLVYDGLHYDALAVAAGDGAGEDRDVTQIPCSGAKTEAAMAAAARLVARFHANRQFTDTANFTLRCGTCGIGLKGEKEAVQHAQTTGHSNFTEY